MLNDHPTDGDSMISPKFQGLIILVIIGSIVWGIKTQNYMIGAGLVMSIATLVVLYDIFKPIGIGLYRLLKGILNRIRK